MTLISINDQVKIFYQKDDFTNPWDMRPTVLLQHGNGRSGVFWFQWVPLLASHYRVVRVDMRGLGQSSTILNPRKDIQIDCCIKDLVQVITQLNCGPIIFCGESMGGILGIILAATHPYLVKALVLISTPVFINQKIKDTYALGFNSRLEAMQQMGIEDWVFKTSVLARFPSDTDPKLLQWYVQEFSKSSPEVLIQYADLVNSADATTFLKDIQCPTLAIMPSNGPITDPIQFKLLADYIPNIDLVTVDSDFHMIHLTHVKSCVDHVMNFLSKLT